jgi:hypothetical protein
MGCPPLRTVARQERSAGAGGRGSRPSGCPGTPSRTGVSGPTGTALRWQGRVVAWAESPRHRRPRLRHRTRRRGAASAASGPRKARARVVTKVHLSAQPPADRSVQRLIPRCCWPAPAACWAARPRSCPPSARQRARTGAAPWLTSLPPRGPPRAHACALLPSLSRPALAPQTALWGWRAGSSRACHHTRASSSTADGTADPHGGSPPYAWWLLLPTGAWAQAGIAARTWRSLLASSPRRWPRPHRGVPASWWSATRSPRRGGVRSCLSVDVGRRHCACRQGALVPGEAGVGWRIPWGFGTPRPLPAETECRSIGLLLGAVCCCGRASVAATAPGRLTGTLHGGIFLGGRALAAARGCRLPRHFFCSWEAQCNACGATARGAARGAYPPMARHGSPPCHCLLRRHWGKRGKEQKK